MQLCVLQEEEAANTHKKLCTVFQFFSGILIASKSDLSIWLQSCKNFICFLHESEILHLLRMIVNDQSVRVSG